MRCILKNIKIHSGSGTSLGNITIDGGIVSSISDSFVPSENFEVIDCDGFDVFPGFADVHVHLREPGFSYKETIHSGTLAAAHGGITAVCAMPNLSPVPDSPENLAVELEAIKRDAVVSVFPYGAITVGEKGQVLSNMDGLAPNIVAFSDDGKGVQSYDMMRSAMKKSLSLGKIIAAHCEDESLLTGGCIHDGEYAAKNGIPGISSASEWRQIERDIHLAEETGCAYHVCHISTKESVRLIREAKHRGVDITCETAPHYLIFTDNDLQNDGRFRMNPPIRSADDRAELILGIQDGTIDMIATDHAPHSAEEKSKGLLGSLNGVVGLETSFAAMYTNLVKPGLISLDRFVELMCKTPRSRFSLGGGTISVGSKADFTVFDLNSKYTVDPGEFLSMGKSSPFSGCELFGRCRMTVLGDKVIWRDI